MDAFSFGASYVEPAIARQCRSICEQGCPVDSNPSVSAALHPSLSAHGAIHTSHVFPHAYANAMQCNIHFKATPA